MLQHAFVFFVMAGLRPGHPRLSCLSSAKTWMPATSPGTTSLAAKQRVDQRWRNLPINKRKWRNTLPLFRPTMPARSAEFVEPDQADATRPVLFAKIFRFTFDPNHLHIPRHPGPHKGAFRDRHERRVGMRWTRVALLTRAQSCGRRSRVVLTPRRWRQVGERDFAGDGDNKARSPRRARNKL